MSIKFSNVIGFTTDLFPLVVLAEQKLGPGNGTAKKQLVCDLAGHLVQAVRTRFSAVFHGGEGLDVQVKDWRDALIDVCVDGANWQGVFPSTMAQKINAGLRLNYIDLGIAAIYKKLQEKQTLTRDEQSDWDSFKAMLPRPIGAQPTPAA